MGRVYGGRVERFLHVHTEIDDVQEELQRPLVLLVAAGRAKGQPRLAVAQCQRRREGRARALARDQRVRMTLVQVKHLAARAEREAQALDDWRRADPTATRRGREQIAPTIDDVDVGGISGHDGPATTT